MIKLEFTLWLRLPENLIKEQLLKALAKVTNGAPSRYSNLNFKLGVGFIASSTKFTDYPQQEDILASATIELSKLVSQPQKFPELFLQELESLYRYYKIIRSLADKNLPAPAFFSQYAQVDYVQNIKQLLPNNSFFATPLNNKNNKNIEEKWLIPQLPTAFGQPFIFYRRYWICPFDLDRIPDDSGDGEFKPEYANFEAWSSYFLIKPEEFAKLAENLKTLELEVEPE